MSWTYSSFNQGLTLRRLNRIDESRRALGLFRQQLPEDPRAFRELAMLDLAQTNTASALVQLSAAVQLDPSWYTPLLDIALIHAEQGLVEESLRYLEMTLDKAPAWLINRVYQQKTFDYIRLVPESKPFEAKLVAQFRQQQP